MARILPRRRESGLSCSPAAFPIPQATPTLTQYSVTFPVPLEAYQTLVTTLVILELEFRLARTLSNDLGQEIFPRYNVRAGQIGKASTRYGGEELQVEVGKLRCNGKLKYFPAVIDSTYWFHGSACEDDASCLVDDSLEMLGRIQEHVSQCYPIAVNLVGTTVLGCRCSVQDDPSV